ncbi:MAG: hypothetical protein IT431_16000 [Phycisphaerales bacterium]|nr:hypothetical protein [Phycisphaerales bacterium]
MTTTAPSPGTTAAPAQQGRGSRLTRWQKRAFLLAFSVCFSLVVLGAAEGVLRLAGYGGYPPTFDKVGTLPDGSTLVMTSHAGPGSYFFANRSRAGSLEPDAFISPKPAGVFRVFLVGESAAKGSPYMPPLTGACLLEQLLGEAWPDRGVEVINLGTTAVASYPVLGMMTEALEYEPDLVIVYAGNNEYYGAYGVSSLHSAGRSARMIRLIRWTRGLAIAQLLDEKLRREPGAGDRTLMEAMVGQAAIGPDDPARASAARTLGVFIGDMVDRCRARGVPVVVCTPPCNERGLAPLGGPVVGGEDADRAAAIREQLVWAAGAVESDAEAAASAMAGLLEEHPSLATAHHVLGRAFAQMGMDDRARTAFRAAVDLDPMPWRPPSGSVEAIRRAAEGGGATLCDLQGAFREASPGGTVGWELMDDHVHPSIAGQELLARTLVRTIAGMGGGLSIPADRLDALPDAGATLERAGWNRYDHLAAANAMVTLGEIGFFRASNPGFFERFDGVCRELISREPPEVVAQITAWLDPATHRGGHRPIAGMVGRAMYELGRYEEADRLFDVARRAATPYGSWELQYSYFMLVARQTHAGELGEADLRLADEAIARGEFLCSLGPTESGGGERYLGELLQMCGRLEESIPYLGRARARLSGVDRVLADAALVRAYARLGDAAHAEPIIREGLQAGGAFVENYRQMAREMGIPTGG